MPTIQSIKDRWFDGMLPWDYVYYLLNCPEEYEIGLRLAPIQAFYMVKEWPQWEKWYQPPGGLKGKVVLDVGAGSGETVGFFLAHGAGSVICLEPDKEYFDNLVYNAKSLCWPVIVYNRGFKASDLVDFQFDFMKMDAEGAEETLLGLHTLPQCTLEIHGPRLYRGFRYRFPEMKFYRTALRRWIGLHHSTGA